MIAVTDHPEGCVLPVRAQPGARKNAVVGEHAGALKVAVTAPPEAGRANDAIVELLRRHLSLKRSQIALIAGHASREKKFLIRGMRKEEMIAKLPRE